MPTIDLSVAELNFIRLVEAVESGLETEIIITCNGRPAARLVPFQPAPSGPRIGVARGAFVVPSSIDIDNTEVTTLMEAQFPRRIG